MDLEPSPNPELLQHLSTTVLNLPQFAFTTLQIVNSYPFLSQADGTNQRMENYGPGPNWNCHIFFFINKILLKKQLHPSVYVFSMTAFMLQRQDWVLVTETTWAKKLKIVTIYPLLKKFVSSWYKWWSSHRGANPDDWIFQFSKTSHFEMTLWSPSATSLCSLQETTHS